MDQFIINIAKQGDLGIALYTLITIVIASILSGIIGFERELQNSYSCCNWCFNNYDCFYLWI